MCEDDFRSDFLNRQADADEAMARGNPELRLALWSKREPVTLLGPQGPVVSGWDQLDRVFRWAAALLAPQKATDFHYNVEVAEVGGELAYTVGYERYTAQSASGSGETVTVRVTQVYRRENGEWKIVHRHSDIAPISQPPAEGTAPVRSSPPSGKPGTAMSSAPADE
jgi:ketosteroid isomerase-like protein